MARVSAYGDITITDLTDVGRITSYLTSSLPLTVLYNPNQTPSYNPNWETTNLVLTPTIFFNDTLLSLTASGLTITWQRQAGSGSVTNLVSGESPSNGKLIVSKNVLEATPIITYICNISYIDPNTNGVEIKSKSQMSFSLSKSAPELSDCSINGDTVFKYNGEGALTSASGIVVFIAAATTLKAGMDKFFTTFEITPPWEKSKKEEKEYRKDVRNQLTDLKQQESDFEKTQLNYRSKNEKTTKEILESISILSEDIKSLRKQIEDMELERKIKKYRWDLNNFATQLSRDVRYGKDQFDIIFQEHEEYESLLREHNMTNGQTTIAMDIIRKYYKKLYFDGNNQN